jgi:hypothetical protein
MTEDLLKIHDWFYNNLLSFNVSKTKYLIFNPIRTKIFPKPNRILVRGAEIERVRCTKYLGLMINERANMFHILRRKSGRFERCLDAPPILDPILNQTFSILLIYPLPFDILGSILVLHHEHEIIRTDPFSK